MNICLICMVRDGEKTIWRMLESVLPLIDSYVIIDTGSADNTKERVAQFFQPTQVPGYLGDMRWIEDDFAANRNHLLQIARYQQPGADYFLWVDADDYIDWPGEPWPLIDPGQIECVRDAGLWPFIIVENMKTRLHPAFNMKITEGPVRDFHRRPHLLASWYNHQWRGPVHEALDVDFRMLPTIDGPEYVRGSGGTRDQAGDKSRKDAAIIERYLLQNPNDAHYWFLLGQGFRDAGEWTSALFAYERRARMSAGTWAEETAVAQLEAARLMARLGRPIVETRQAFLRAFEISPRPEILVALAEYYESLGWIESARGVAGYAIRVEDTKDTYYVDREAKDRARELLVRIGPTND